MHTTTTTPTPSRPVQLEAAGAALFGDLAVPEGAEGVVLMAYGTGGGRHRPENRQIANALNEERLATLLVDLLSPQEESVEQTTGRYEEDAEHLAARLDEALAWVSAREELASLPTFVLAEASVAPAALLSASRSPERVRALVLRGGRVDRAEEALWGVRAPTLLLARGPAEAEADKEAARAMSAHVRVEVLPNEDPTSDEPGTPKTAAEAASEWFTAHLH